jgi:hypothetical protein
MPPPQPDRKFGWAGSAVAARERIRMRGAGEFPQDYGRGPELVLRADDVAVKRLGLWEFVRDRNRMRHWECIRQEIGDCVSHGWSHCGLIAGAVEMVLNGKPVAVVKPFPPYVYGTSRVQIGGGRIRGDGSLGSWAAAAVKKYGYIPENAPSCPKYGGSLAREWGRSGPPAEFLKIGQQFLADVRLVQTFDEAVSAIATGHPVAVCSDVGFEKIVERNGRIEGVRQGSWPHCMAFIGYDVNAGSEALYCWNSWGPTAHAPEESYDRLDKAPPGGFWVLKKDAEAMLRQQDSFAVSFNGFTAAPLWARQQAMPKEEDDDDDEVRFLRRDRRRVGDVLLRAGRL